MTKWTILVPLDGSPLSERALPYAERLAEATSARMVLCRTLAVFAARPADDLDSADEARAYLQRLAEQLSNNGRTVETALLWGEAAPEILKTGSLGPGAAGGNGHPWPVRDRPLVVR